MKQDFQINAGQIYANIPSVIDSMSKVDELFKWLQICTKHTFRGNDRVIDYLCPSLFRGEKIEDKIKKFKSIIENDKKIHGKFQARDPWESAIYVQHLRGETFLFDFTCHPFVALYFACSNFDRWEGKTNNNHDFDGQLVVLDTKYTTKSTFSDVDKYYEKLVGFQKQKSDDIFLFEPVKCLLNLKDDFETTISKHNAICHNALVQCSEFLFGNIDAINEKLFKITICKNFKQKILDRIENESNFKPATIHQQEHYFFRSECNGCLLRDKKINKIKNSYLEKINRIGISFDNVDYDEYSDCIKFQDGSRMSGYLIKENYNDLENLFNGMLRQKSLNEKEWNILLWLLYTFIQYNQSEFNHEKSLALTELLMEICKREHIKSDVQTLPFINLALTYAAGNYFLSGDFLKAWEYLEKAVYAFKDTLDGLKHDEFVALNTDMCIGIIMTSVKTNNQIPKELDFLLYGCLNDELVVKLMEDNLTKSEFSKIIEYKNSIKLDFE